MSVKGVYENIITRICSVEILLFSISMEASSVFLISEEKIKRKDMSGKMRSLVWIKKKRKHR